jgi:phosphoribosylformimino-5-aminoimidazole carboxamide ribotide isomerase
MRLFPVIDLLDDHAVHAIKGTREHYRPVQSVLCDTSDPLALAAAFRDQLRLDEIYIADLNAIQGFSCMRHQSLIGDLCRIEGVRIILDAGISDVEKAQAWLDHGVHKVVIGSETLGALDDLQSISARIEPHRLLSRCHLLASMTPMEALNQLQLAGWREIILLDLHRVGSREGVDATLVAEAQECFPDLHLLVGGGIAKPQELIELKSIGVAGILVATALHNGAITAQHISRFLIPDS